MDKIEEMKQDLKNAQLARDEIKVAVLRLLLAEIHNGEISKGGQLTDPDIVSIIQREVKKRKEAAAGFRSGNREDSAKKEEAEEAVLQGYLPEALSNEELTSIIEDTITELEAKGLINEVGVKSMQDMGKVMGVVMGKVAGRADGGTVSSLVKQKLS